MLCYLLLSSLLSLSPFLVLTEQVNTKKNHALKQLIPKLFLLCVQIRTWTSNVALPDAVRNPVIPIDVYLQAAELAAMEGM